MKSQTLTPDDPFARAILHFNRTNKTLPPLPGPLLPPTGPPPPSVIYECGVPVERWNHPVPEIRDSYREVMISIVMERARVERARTWELVSEQVDLLACGTQTEFEIRMK